jgi:competence protein ComEC
MADRFDSAQSDARRASAGLWAEAACGTATDARLRIVEVEFDAPGDDGLDPNGEWVRVRNDGSEPVDLTGWTVKDESSSHRYRFPSSFTLPAGATVTLRTGCGDDSRDELFWCTVGSAVWNNDGDTAFLLDPQGNTHSTLAHAG